ncbi:MAG: PAS domain S-box protein, partial [Proteobacteria bacterium]|nr:PAS domain S-box protein [Pseudomonadota bacterium]
MSIYAAASLLNCAVALCIGALVLGRDLKGPINRLYFALCLMVIYISFCEFGLRIADHTTAYTWLKAGFLWPFALPMFLHFVFLFANKKKVLANKAVLIGMYLPSCFFAAADLTTDLISGEPVLYYWGWSYAYTPSWPNNIGMVWASAMMVMTVVFSFSHALTVKGPQRRKQAWLVCIGISLPIVVGLFTEVIIPSAFTSRIPELETLAFTLGSAIIGYGIWRYGLFALSPAMAADNIFTNISDVLLLIGPDGTILRANPATKTHLGYEEEELVQATATVLETKDTATTKAFKEQTFTRLAKEEKITDLEVQLRTKDGRNVPFSMSLTSLRDPDGKLLGFVCIARDINA